MTTVRHVESVCNHRNDASIHVEPVDLVGEPRGRPKILQISVGDIGKVELFVARIDRDVVERVELTAKVIIKDHSGRVRFIRIKHVKCRRYVCTLSLSSEDNFPPVGSAAVRVDDLNGAVDNSYLGLVLFTLLHCCCLEKRNLFHHGRLV